MEVGEHRPFLSLMRNPSLLLFSINSMLLRCKMAATVLKQSSMLSFEKPTRCMDF